MAATFKQVRSLASMGSSAQLLGCKLAAHVKSIQKLNFAYFLKKITAYFPEKYKKIDFTPHYLHM